MRTFKMNPELRQNIENILLRRGVDYNIVDREHISVNLSGTQFHKVITRARMEYMEQQDFAEYLRTHMEPPIAYLAKSEVNDSKVRAEVGSAFVIK